MSNGFAIEEARGAIRDVRGYVKWRNLMDDGKEIFEEMNLMLELCNVEEKGIPARATPNDKLSSFLCDNEDVSKLILSFLFQERGAGDLREAGDGKVRMNNPYSRREEPWPSD